MPGSAAYGSSGSLGMLGGSNNSSSSSGSMMVSSSSGAVPTGTAAMRSGSGSGSGGRLSSSQWQQQQWQQQAFGELLHPRPALQRVTVGDVARLKQVVPGSAAPCVSELAAAVRAFPVGALSATTATATAAGAVTTAVGQERQAGLLASTAARPGQLSFSSAPVSHAAAGGSPKGLRLLLSSQQQELQLPAAEAVGSPCFAVGAGGRLAAVAGAAAVAAAAGNAAAGGMGVDYVPACGRRAPLGRELSARLSD